MATQAGVWRIVVWRIGLMGLMMACQPSAPRPVLTTPPPEPTAPSTPTPTPVPPPGTPATDLMDWIVIQAYQRPGLADSAHSSSLTQSRHSPSSLTLSRTEVTVDQYAACVAARACELPAGDRQALEQCNWGYPDRGQHPINCVTWDQAATFAAWVGGRLPSEQEWTLGARGGSQRLWPWGSTPATCALSVMNASKQFIDLKKLGCGMGGTAPVCSRPKGNTPEGLCDMSGNLWEWVDSRLEPGQTVLHDHSEDIADDGRPVQAAHGSEDGTIPAMRVLRGGSWYNDAKYVRPQARLLRRGTAWHRYYGFRVVGPTQQPGGP